jgi:TrmH family RNA methyltransferase
MCGLITLRRLRLRAGCALDGEGCNMKKITSRDNPDFRQLLRLARSGKARRAAGQILLDGTHLIDAYVAAFGAAGITLVARASALDSVETRRWTLAGEPALVLADGLFNDLSPVETPTGVLALAPIPRQPGQAGAGFTVFLDGVQDPGNLGAILRSAAAAGAACAVLSPQCADPWSPKCLRGGMGAQFVLAVQDHQDLIASIRAFPGRVLAADSQAATALFEVDLSGTVGFVVGAEGLGISEPVLAVCTGRVRIPMARGIESLNASAAATLLFYEWRRTRG